MRRINFPDMLNVQILLSQVLSNGGIVWFSCGVIWIQQLIALPQGWQFVALLALLLVAIRFRYAGLLALLLGLLWASAYGYQRLGEVLPESALGLEVPVQGYISNLPQIEQERSSFEFVVTTAPQQVPRKLRLAWYYPVQRLAAGQSWQFTVKLKPPHGRLNPGNFDYQAWLFANGVGATGYVRDKAETALIDSKHGLSQVIAGWRQALADQIDAQLPANEFAGVIKALTLGAQTDITQAQWDLFRVTGTTHLAVISGSHITLVAGLVFLLMQQVLLRLGRLHWPVQRIAAILAWLAAVVYALLAGWSVPVQRAIVMLTVSLWAITLQRHVSAWRILGLALLAVLLFDPLAVISIGFWLSFGAVALLLYTSACRMGRTGFWRELSVAQWTTALGLAPVLLLFFQQISLVSPLANAIAVPVMGFVTVPLALLAVVCGMVWPGLGSWGLALAAESLHGLWWLLQQLANWSWVQLFWPAPSPVALGLALLGVLLALAPRGFPGRHLALFLWLPLVFAPQDRPEAGEASLTMLDVGQGLAVVIQTQQHVLLFDTGAKFSEQSDMGESVILPYLRNAGIRAIDLLMISHGDNDHSGGAQAIMAALPVKQLLSSVEPWAVQEQGAFCRAGQQWQWDGVWFRVLSPTEKAYPKENNNSCVLQVQTVGQQWLLTGDIEREAELDLVHEWGERLHSTVLIAPHHGSKTSSSEPFLQAVQAQLVLIPAGYANRFHFPHSTIIQRYRNYQIPWVSSAQDGAVAIQSYATAFEFQTAKQQLRRYWMQN